VFHFRAADENKFARCVWNKLHVKCTKNHTNHFKDVSSHTKWHHFCWPPCTSFHHPVYHFRKTFVWNYSHCNTHGSLNYNEQPTL